MAIIKLGTSWKFAALSSGLLAAYGTYRYLKPAAAEAPPPSFSYKPPPSPPAGQQQQQYQHHRYTGNSPAAKMTVDQSFQVRHSERHRREISFTTVTTGQGADETGRPSLRCPSRARAASKPFQTRCTTSAVSPRWRATSKTSSFRWRGPVS